MEKSKSHENEGPRENVGGGSVGNSEGVGKGARSSEGRAKPSQKMGSVEEKEAAPYRQKTASTEKVQAESRSHTVTPSMTSAASARRSKNVSFEEYPPYDDRTIASQRGHDSLSDESVISEEIEVIITDEHRDYVERMTIGKLSRAGLGQSFKWSKLEYYCVVISYTLSLDAVAMFNYCVSRLGMYWLIVFLICMYFIGFPLTYLELALGQYTHACAVTIFNRIAPVSVGVGVSTVIMVASTLIIGNDFLEVSVSVLYGALDFFINELPFDNCVADTSRPYCQSLDKDCSLIRNPLLEATHAAAFNFEKYRYMPIGDSCVHNDIKKWDEGYTENTMEAAGLLNKIPIIHFTHAGFENLTLLQQNVWPYPSAMATTIGMYCLMAFLLTYRRRYISIMAYIYVALTFVVTVSIIVVYTYLAQPKYPSSRVFETEIRLFAQDTWFTGIILAVLVLKLGYGGMIFLGSQNQFHNDLVTDAMVITVAVSFIYMAQAMVHSLVRDSFVLEAYLGDYQIFNETLSKANDFGVKMNRSGSRAISLYMGSFKIFGSFYAPMVLLMATFGTFASFVSKVCFAVRTLVILRESQAFYPEKQKVRHEKDCKTLL
ncbi:hypothetical protein Aduo_000931 [Ancylostoma duodenale]